MRGWTGWAAAGLAAAGWLGAMPAGAETGPVRTGMTYAAARGALIGAGYKPVASGEKDDGRCSAGRQDVCNAYPETVSCSGTGHAECRFIFSGRAGAGMTLEADGPDVARLKVTAVRRSSKKDVDWQKR